MRVRSAMGLGLVAVMLLWCTAGDAVPISLGYPAGGQGHRPFLVFPCLPRWLCYGPLRI